MATFEQQAAIARDSALRFRVESALAKVANNVRNENPLDTGTFPNGQSAERIVKRQALASQCRIGVEAVTVAATRLVAENNAVQTACTYTGTGASTAANTSAVPDNDIEYQLNQTWDILAGVLPSEMDA